MTDEDIQDIIKEVDYKGNKKINYSEFLAATIKISEHMTESKAMALFKQFDTDGSGDISPENILETMAKQGIHMTRDEILEIM